MSKVLIKRCTPHRPFVKWYRGVKRKRLHGDHFRITVEPVIVKKYRKPLVNGGFCKKKLDTRFDTHCIKTGVQLWCARQDLNLHACAMEPKGDVTLVKEKIQKYVGGVKCILSTEIQVQSDKLPVRHTFVRSQICKTSRKSTK